MTWKRKAELLLPGFVIGLGAGAVAGGLAAMGGLSARYVIASMLALSLPLAVAGAGYNALLAAGRIRLAGVTPAAVYWLACFPAARVVHELALDGVLGQPFGLPEGTAAFVGFQAMISVGFAVGFIWLHERVGSLWWVRIRDHNPIAQQYVVAYMGQAAREAERREAAKGRRQDAPRDREDDDRNREGGGSP